MTKYKKALLKQKLREVRELLEEFYCDIEDVNALMQVAMTMASLETVINFHLADVED